MILAKIGGSILINQKTFSKDFFEHTLRRIFKLKSKNGQYRYHMLDLMKMNMKNNKLIESKYEIKKIINYFLKEL